MKKEKSPILVIFCIFLLSLFIILPPVFRKMLPREEETNNQEELQQPKLVVVNCNITYPNELYQISSRTKYSGDNPPINTITFTKLETLPENYQSSDIVPTTNATEELTYLKSIPNMQFIENQNVITFTIDNAIISSVSDDEKISQYLSEDYDIQKTTLEALGYTCNVLEP